MRIIDREKFLCMPEGTVFMKFQGGFGELSIKEQTVGRDFRYFTLDPSVNCEGGDDAIDMANCDQNLNVPIEIKHSCKDDDVQAGDQKFAIWSRSDVDSLMLVLGRMPSTQPVST